MKFIAIAAILAVPFAATAQEGAATAAPPAGETAPVAPAAPKIDGKYRFVGGEKEQKALEDAIEKVVQEMLFIKRPIARGRLKDRNKIAVAWSFATAGGQIKSTAEGIMSWSSPENGAPADVKTSTGDDAKLTQKMSDNKLTQIFTTKEGKREDIFTLAADGTLTLSVVLTSEQLPIPLQYTLTYKK
jgi:hypothetical protein